MDKVIRTNHHDNDLWCVDCKEKIYIGQKYITVFEEIYNGEVIEKYYHVDCNWKELEDE